MTAVFVGMSEKDKKAVLDAIEDLGPTRHDAIVDETGLPKSIVQEAVIILVDEGKVRSTLDWRYEIVE